MTSRDTRDIEAALLSKGFCRSDSHHRFFNLLVNGVPHRIGTFLSHGIAEYGDALLARVARQLHLSKRELLDFIDCKLSSAGYLQLMRERGKLD